MDGIYIEEVYVYIHGYIYIYNIWYYICVVVTRKLVMELRGQDDDTVQWTGLYRVESIKEYA